ncbi:MAG: ABC transporter permease [Candidatus Caldatribacteriota bacterium]|nr:ABC transporter permease [Candidatus Caldatribacteriota bacterium]
MKERYLKRALGQYWGVLGTLLAINLFFGLTSPYYFTPYNLVNILDHSAITMILATGMVFVISTGGIDLSVGSTLGLTGVVTALLFKAGVPVLFALALGLSTGALIGTINGLVISKFRLQPFIVTLAMLSIARGLALVLSGGQPVLGLPVIFVRIFSGHGVIRNSIFIGFIVAVIGAYVAGKTRYGLYARSIGSNEDCAHLCGIKIRKMKIIIYATQGLLATLASFVFMSIMDAAEPIAGMQTEWIEAIAAPIIGGSRLSGGKLSMLGTVIGVFILSSIRSGLNIFGVQPWYQQLFIGLIIIAAVVANTITRKET